MLTLLHIKDFAIVTAAELEFGTGLNVLTGETGAGKSILVDAVGLVLGDRADAAQVRHGAGRAEIAAHFDLRGDTGAGATAWLVEREMDADNELVIRRTIGADGRSRAFVNGSTTTLKELRELGGFLADIHGQHAHQSLTRRGVQLAMVDATGNYTKDLARVADAYAAWRDVRDERLALLERLDSQDLGLDLIQHQVGELEAMGLGDDEYAALDEEQRRLANVSSLIEAGRVALGRLAGSDLQPGASSAVADARRSLSEHTHVDKEFVDMVATLVDIESQLDELVAALSRYAGDVETDPARLAFVEARLGSAHDLARKHRIEPAGLPAQLSRLRERLDEVTDADARLAKLEQDEATLAAAYRKTAATLSGKRKRAAARIGESVTALMHELSLGGTFSAEVTRGDDDTFTATGIDVVQFVVALNPGQPLRPLAKVASGGELSRLSLALQLVTSGGKQPVMVFDEVDAGVGGGTAERVGRKLRELSASAQVLCVTHLAQVACQGHHHMRVAKAAAGKITRVAITQLGDGERVEELSRMLGGVNITAKTRAHAKEMLERAADKRADKRAEKAAV